MQHGSSAPTSSGLHGETHINVLVDFVATRTKISPRQMIVELRKQISYHLPHIILHEPQLSSGGLVCISLPRFFRISYHQVRSGVVDTGSVSGQVDLDDDIDTPLGINLSASLLLVATSIHVYSPRRHTAQLRRCHPHRRFLLQSKRLFPPGPESREGRAATIGCPSCALESMSKR